MADTFDDDKAQVLVLTHEQHCKEDYKVIAATSYAELFANLTEFSETFGCLTDYLESLLSVFEDAVMQANKILFNQTIASVTNYFFIAKANITTALTINTSQPNLFIHDSSVVEEIIITGGATVGYLLVAGNSIVRKITIVAGSKIEYISIATCFGNQATKIELIEGMPGRFDMEEGAVFGGFECIDVIPLP